MDPQEYKGTEWRKLLDGMTAKEIKSTLKKSYRVVGNKARKIALEKLRASGLKTNASLEKSLRLYVYGRGGGFVLTTKARSSRNSKNERGMYTNSRGMKKPVLMWAAEGTKKRCTKSKTRIFVRVRKGHNTGSMANYRFMDAATPEAYKIVEADLAADIETIVIKTAKKAGLA